jgi:hypothetical protein
MQCEYVEQKGKGGKGKEHDLKKKPTIIPVPGIKANYFN